ECYESCLSTESEQCRCVRVSHQYFRVGPDGFLVHMGQDPDGVFPTDRRYYRSDSRVGKSGIHIDSAHLWVIMKSIRVSPSCWIFFYSEAEPFLEISNS